MSSNLSPDNERYLEHAVATGMYHDRGKALDSAVELLRRRGQLIRDVNKGIEQLERGAGRPLDIEKVKAAVRQAFAVFNQGEKATDDPWLKAFDDWVDGHKPLGHSVDDSRESIYSGTIDDPR